MKFRENELKISQTCIGSFRECRQSRGLGFEVKLLLPAALAGMCAWSGVAEAQVEVGVPQQIQEDVELGTNPARMTRSIEIRNEYLSFGDGVGNNTLRLSYTQPFGPAADWSLKVTLPYSSFFGIEGDPSALGDVSFKVTHVLSIGAEQGWAASAEYFADTADPGLGFGQNALKLQIVNVQFLDSGALFAPTLLQTIGLGNEEDDADLNISTVDFYYVPKLADPRTLLTFDPNVTYDWTNENAYAGLSITAGRMIGQAFGGNMIAYAKPSVFAGGDRPSDWGLEVGFKVIGF